MIGNEKEAMRRKLNGMKLKYVILMGYGKLFNLFIHLTQHGRLTCDLIV